MKYIALVLLLFLLTACGQLTPDGTGILFRTADPALSIGFRLLAPPPGAPVAPVVAPDPVAVELEETEADDQACDIKLNVAGNGEKIFHVPTGQYYSRVRIDFERGEGYACSVEEAEAAGWRAAQN